MCLVGVTADGLRLRPVSARFADRYPHTFTEWVAQRVAAFDRGESLEYVCEGTNPHRFVPRKPIQYIQDNTKAVLFAVAWIRSTRLYLLACTVNSTLRYVVHVEPACEEGHEEDIGTVFKTSVDFTDFVANALESARKTWGALSGDGFLGSRGWFDTTPVAKTVPRVHHVRRRVAFPASVGRTRNSSAAPACTPSTFPAASVRFCAGHHKPNPSAVERGIVGHR